MEELVGNKFRRRIVVNDNGVYRIEFKYNNKFFGWLFGWDNYWGDIKSLDYAIKRVWELHNEDLPFNKTVKIK